VQLFEFRKKHQFQLSNYFKTRELVRPILQEKINNNNNKHERTMGPNYFKNLKESAVLMLFLVHCQFMNELKVNWWFYG
jgi:hypothetical protein